MKLEAGKYYEDVCGQVHGPLLIAAEHFRGEDNFPSKTFSDGLNSWFEDGAIALTQSAKMDLVKQVLVDHPLNRSSETDLAGDVINRINATILEANEASVDMYEATLLIDGETNTRSYRIRSGEGYEGKIDYKDTLQTKLHKIIAQAGVTTGSDHCIILEVDGRKWKITETDVIKIDGYDFPEPVETLTLFNEQIDRLREVVDAIKLNRTGTIVVDEFHPENLHKAMFGNAKRTLAEELAEARERDYPMFRVKGGSDVLEKMDRATGEWKVVENVKFNGGSVGPDGRWTALPFELKMTNPTDDEVRFVDDKPHVSINIEGATEEALERTKEHIQKVAEGIRESFTGRKPPRFYADFLVSKGSTKTNFEALMDRVQKLEDMQADMIARMRDGEKVQARTWELLLAIYSKGRKHSSATIAENRLFKLLESLGIEI